MRSTDFDLNSVLEPALTLREKLFEFRLNYAEYLDTRERALALAQLADDELLIAELSLFGIRILFRCGREADARSSLDRAKAIFELHNNHAGLGLWKLGCSVVQQIETGSREQIQLLRAAIKQLENHSEPRHQLRALHDLNVALSEVGLLDASIETGQEMLNRAQNCTPQNWMYSEYALVDINNARLMQLSMRFGEFSIPIDAPEASALRRHMESMLCVDSSGEYPQISEWLRLHLLSYVELLLGMGCYVEAERVWQKGIFPWKELLPAYSYKKIEALIAVFCKRDCANATALLTEIIAAPPQSDPYEMVSVWLAQSLAHAQAGNYKVAYEAQKNYYDLRAKFTGHSTPIQAAMLGYEPKSESDKALIQQALAHVGKLIAIGQLSSSLAHEINQPASTLVLLSRQLRSNLLLWQWESLTNTANDIQLQSDRLSILVGRLKNFARNEAISLVVVSVKYILEQAQGLYYPRIKVAGVKYIVNVAEEFIMADEERLCLALTNIVGNALDALVTSAQGQIDGSPQICIETRQVKDGSEVLLIVRDNGPGLSKEAEMRLFEPFYTGKPANQGLGLGLAITKEALSSMGASIRISNHPQGGAEVVIGLQAANRVRPGNFETQNDKSPQQSNLSS